MWPSVAVAFPIGQLEAHAANQASGCVLLEKHSGRS